MTFAVFPVDQTTPGFRVSSEYGWRTIDGIRQFHNGIDLAVPVGSPVFAVERGTVRWIDTVDDDPSGLHVGVRHPDGKTTSYAHLSRVLVVVGQELAAGDVIAESGNTGRSGGPHVHFRVRTPTAAHVDPRPLLPFKSAGVAPILVAGLALMRFLG